MRLILAAVMAFGMAGGANAQLQCGSSRPFVPSHPCAPGEAENALAQNQNALAQNEKWATQPATPGPVVAFGSDERPRRYTLDDIDRMRFSIEVGLHASLCVRAVGCRAPPSDEYLVIEERLRTYMQAGISPGELEAKAEGKK